MVKKRDLERELRACGWSKTGGTKHDKWTKDELTVMVPRHAEIGESMAREIRKEAGLR
jgi:hypothetical protein